MNVLLLASGFVFQYRVLRCAAAAGAAVHVLGDRRAGGLARSRHIASFTPADCDLTTATTEQVAEQVNRVARRLQIDLVLPTDGATTAVLAAARDRLAVPCFPIPSAETFALLNDKGRFMQACAELGVPHPASWLATKEELRERHREGRLALPCIVKPPCMFGKIGVQKLDHGDAGERIERIDYAPVLVQDFVPGEDVCISLFCDGGEVLAEVAYTRRRGTFYFTHDARLSQSARQIARHFRYDGVLAFDSRRTPDGERIEFIECNPRFWFNMDVAMLCGINFVDLGLRLCAGQRVAAPSVSGRRVSNVRGILATLARPWKLGATDVRTLRYHLSDPAVSILLASGLGRRLEDRV